MRKLTRLFHVFIVLALFLSACNLPSNDPEDISATAAAATVQALLSATPASPATATSAPATLTPIPLPTNTNTPAPTATPTCPQAQFVTDVTIPDGTVMTAGQSFTKKWRIRNTGQCAWNGYTLVFDSGDSMSGPASKPIGVVNPGQEVDLEVNLTAPNTAGNYRGYWRIVTNNNVLVPMLNGYQGRAFYVDIKVQAPPTATNTSAPAFTVTSVTYNVSGTCGNFQISANITTNGPGTVTYFWQANGYDDFEGTYGSTLNFESATTKTTPSISWSISAPGSHYLKLFVNSPNNQFFGQTNSMNCP